MIGLAELKGILESHGFFYEGKELGPRWLRQVHALLKRKVPYSSKESRVTWIGFSEDPGEYGDYFSLRANDIQMYAGLLGPREELPQLLVTCSESSRLGSVCRALIEAQLRYR